MDVSSVSSDRSRIEAERAAERRAQEARQEAQRDQQAQERNQRESDSVTLSEEAIRKSAESQ